MLYLFAIATLLLVGLAMIHLTRSKYGPRASEDEIHFTHSPDGWRLALHRYRPRGENPHGEPVLLHHGLASNHYTFDLGVGTEKAPVPSIAHWLADRGYDVWVCDLRGRHDSDRPGFFTGRGWSWTVDDFLHKDDRAFIDYILARSPYQQIHWIGHSLGGILQLCWCAIHGSPQVASGVTVGSAFSYGGAGSRYEPLLKLTWLAKYVRRLPMGKPAQLFAPLTGKWQTHMEEFNYWFPNTAPAAARAIHAGVLQDASTAELVQLATLFHENGIKSADGRTNYMDLASSVQTPTLLLAGDRDMQCPPSVVHRTHSLMKGDHKVEVFGKERGLPEHYGHFDMLVGLRAEQEVFPVILDWLRAHPSKHK